jgi:hypothetical protein
MNRQNMGGKRSAFHRTPAATQHDGEEDEYDDEVWPARLPTSTRRYTNIPAQQGAATQQPRKRVVNVYDLPTNIPLRSSRTTTHGYALPPGQSAPRPTPVQPSHRTGHRVHWMVLVGMGMLAMGALWVVGTGLVTWGSTQLDDWHYGRPRTFQMDARVGHDDAVTPSHFIALNLNRHVIIIEFPGGDPTRAKDYLGPTLFGDGQDLTPVTLSFKDVNGDGKLDMLVHIQDQTFVFLNDGTQFRPLKPGEHVTL